jgi:hypothetical protein
MAKVISNPVLDKLEVLIPKLPEKDRYFAGDLIRKGRKYGASEGQMKWVNILIDRANGKSPDKIIGDVGNFLGVYSLFAKAKQALKFPKLRLSVKGMPLVLSVAGDKSAKPGVINVTDGGPFGNNKWYGRIAPDGSWELPMKEYPEIGEVAALLKQVGEDPHQAAANYGKLTGYCCFCQRALSDEKSVAVGYGPVCAEKWGLKDQWKKAQSILPKAVLEAA